MLTELSLSEHWELLADFAAEKLRPIVSANCGQHHAVAELIGRLGDWSAPYVWAMYGKMRTELSGPMEWVSTESLVGPEYADMIDDAIHGLSRGIVCGPSRADTGRIVRLATGKDWEEIETERPSTQCPHCGKHSQRFHHIANAGRVRQSVSAIAPTAEESLVACYRRIDHMTMGVC